MVDENPVWFRDAKWLCGIFLVPSLAVALWYFGLAQLSARGRGAPVLERVLQLTLLPEGTGGASLAVRQGLDYTPGEPLQLLPGVEVYADVGEIPGFSLEEADNRIAGVLAERVITGGVSSAQEAVTNVEFGDQLARAFEGPVALIVRARLEASMMPSGLDNGSRLANWPLQARRRPGEPVQPVVGVFVYVDPTKLQDLSDREIGELVVRELADVVLSKGLAAAQEKVGNSNLLQRLTDTVQNEVRSSLLELFSTLLVSRRALLASRLEQAQAALAEEDAQENGLLGIAGVEVQGLTTEQANAAVLRELSERTYQGGTEAVLPLLSDAHQEARLQSAAWVVDRFTRTAHRRYLRLTWLFGVVSFLLLAGLVFFSAGLGRLFNLGLVMVLAALLFGGPLYLLSGRLDAAAGPPAGLREVGAFQALVGLVRYIGSGFVTEAREIFSRNHLVVLLSGAGLILLSLLIRLSRVVRPRRRSLL